MDYNIYSIHFTLSDWEDQDIGIKLCVSPMGHQQRHQRLNPK